MENKSVKIIVFLLIVQIAVTLWGVWYIVTNPERKLNQECLEYMWKEFPLNSDEKEVRMKMRMTVYEGCLDQGGGKRFDWLNDIRNNTNDIVDKLNI